MDEFPYVHEPGMTGFDSALLLLIVPTAALLIVWGLYAIGREALRRFRDTPDRRRLR